MKKLSQIIKFITGKKIHDLEDREVLKITIDSREVDENSAFIALKGAHVNGLKFAKKAQDNGAIAIIYEEGNEPTKTQLKGISIPVIEMPKGISLGLFASWFYDSPSEHLKLIGITGTNGKSTITQLIAQWLKLAYSAKCAVFGTLGYGFLDNLHKSANTTLDAVHLQSALSEILKEGAQYATLEVSSIGVCEGRIDGLSFKSGGFTNLTRDHLDYHKTMENYAEAKLDFLKRVPQSQLAINFDNETGLKFAKELQNSVIYSIDPNFRSNAQSILFERYVWIKEIQYKKDGISLEVESSFGKGQCTLNLLGSFNVENFACALTVLLAQGLSLDRLLEVASKLKPICGRMERFSSVDKPQLVVDYAHTPDGVEQVLRGVKLHHKDGKVWCVLGCGGDRDRGKRPIMAIKASVFADMAVFTSDNPRTEDPEAILKDMQSGVNEASNVITITDRRKAIEYAFNHATADDCVVIAGKGHEDYQILKDKTIHFSDREIACELLGISCD